MNDQVRNVVDRYLSVVLVADVNCDAGWRAEHLIGRLMDTAGCLTFSGTAGGNSNGQMIYQMGLMIEQTVSPYSRWCVKAMQLLKQFSVKQHDALVATVFYKNRPNPERETDYHSQDDIAKLVGLSRAAYQSNLYKAESYLSDLLELRVIEKAG